MKLILIGPTYPFRGGISHYTTLLYQELTKKHNLKFFTFSRPYPKFLFPVKPEADKSKKAIKAKRAIPTIDWANPFSWLKTAVQIRKFKPKMVIFPWWMWGWATPFTTISLLSKALTKTKILFLCHNVVEHETSKWKKLLTKLALSTGDFFIVHSQTELESLRKLLPRKVNIKKTFHPTYDVFKFKKTTKAAAKKKLKLKGNIILFFGHVRAYKGLNYLLEAMPIILNELDITLVIAGEFWENKKRFQDQIDKLKIKNWVKIFDKYIPNEEVGFYFQAADLVILPYISATGTGITQIAFGFGKPVIGTKVGDLPEVIGNQRRGLIVPPKDSQKLAKAIIKCYQDNLIPNLEKNIKKDKHLFSWNNLVKVIESFS